MQDLNIGVLVIIPFFIISAVGDDIKPFIRNNRIRRSIIVDSARSVTNKSLNIIIYAFLTCRDTWFGIDDLFVSN